MLHILTMYFEHCVSFRFGIQATLGPYASLSSALQAALGHETTVCGTFGARWRNTYFCRCRGCYQLTCFTNIVCASSLLTRFPMWFAWCTLNNGHVGTFRCGLSTVALSDAKVARCPSFMTRRLRHYCRLCVAASFVWRSLLRSF